MEDTTRKLDLGIQEQFEYQIKMLQQKLEADKINFELQKVKE